MGNDFSLDSLQKYGFTNKLTDRGPQKRSGVSFDYMDKLNPLVDQGIFVDKDGDGFTKAEAQALGNEFLAIHKEKGYNTKFTKMRAGTTFNYTYDDFIRLAQAAGYVLKDTSESEVKYVVEDVVKKINEELKDIETTTEEESGDELEPTSKSGLETLNAIAASLPDGEYDIHFKGYKLDTGKGKVVGERAKGTINGSPFVYTNPGQGSSPANSKPAATDASKSSQPAVQLSGSVDDIKAYLDADSAFAGKTGEEKAEILRQRGNSIDAQIRELSSEQTHTKRGFLGLGKKKTVVDKTAEQAQQENAAQIADLRVQRDNIDRAMVYARTVEGQYWNSKKTVTGYPTYQEHTTSDGRRVLRTSEYVRNEGGLGGHTVYHYYNPQVALIQGAEGTQQPSYYDIVPDLENELTDVESAK